MSEVIVAKRVTLATSWLGVCVAIAIADDELGIGGIVHAMLPNSRLDPRRAGARPGTFVDTGIARLVEDLLAQGALRGRLTAWLAGAAKISIDPGALKVGEQNLQAAEIALADAKVPVLATAVGGRESRAMRLEVGQRCVVLGRGGEVVL
jgi:chemotaxis protein CheD